MEVPPFLYGQRHPRSIIPGDWNLNRSGNQVQDRGIGRDELGIKRRALPFKAVSEPALLSDLSKS